MPNPTCFGSLGAYAIRAAKLDAAGAPVPGANNGYVSTAMIQVGISVELSTGDDLEQKNAAGDICLAFKYPDKIKRLNLTMQLCQLDAYLIQLLAGGSNYLSGGVPIGWQFPSVAGGLTNYASLEVWTQALDGSSPAVPTFTSPSAAYIHWVFPRTQWTMGDVTIESGLMTVPLNGQGFENDALTTNGPFNDWPTAISNQGGVTAVGGWFYDATLPTATCAPTTVAALS